VAEVHFFMTHPDTEHFVQFLIENFGARFAFDHNPTSMPIVATTTADVLNAVKDDESRGRFFVQSHLWDRFPLRLSEIHAVDGQHFWSVDQRIGGPAFDFCVSAQRSEEGRSWILPGMLSDYPWYIMDKSSEYETFDRPAGMATAYRQVQNYLRRNGVRSVCGGTGEAGPFILKGALAAFENGMWLRQGDGHFTPKKRR